MGLYNLSSFKVILMSIEDNMRSKIEACVRGRKRDRYMIGADLRLLLF